MQVFVPYKEFSKCAESIDTKRLWKQILECKQIHDAINWIKYGNDPESSNVRKKPGYVHHPVTLLWKDHQWALYSYQWWLLKRWILIRTGFVIHHETFERYELPDWLTDEVTDWYKGLLYDKDSEHYKDWKEYSGTGKCPYGGNKK